MKRWIASFLAVMLLLSASFPGFGEGMETMAEENTEEKQAETDAETEEDMEEIPSVSFPEAEEIKPIYAGDDPLYHNSQPEISQVEESQPLPNEECLDDASCLAAFEPDCDPAAEEAGSSADDFASDQSPHEHEAKAAEASPQEPMEPGAQMLDKCAPILHFSCIGEEIGGVWHLRVLPSTEAIRIYWENTQAEKYRILFLDAENESIMDYVTEAQELWLDPGEWTADSPYQMILQALYPDGDMMTDSLLFQFDLIKEENAPNKSFMEPQEPMGEDFQEPAEQIPMDNQTTPPEWNPGLGDREKEENRKNDPSPGCNSSQDGFPETSGENMMIDETTVEAEKDAQESQSEENAVVQLSSDDESDTLAELPQVTDHGANEESGISPGTDSGVSISKIIPDDEQDCTQPEENEKYEDGSSFTEDDKDDLASEAVDSTDAEDVQDEASVETIKTDSTKYSADSTIEETDASDNLSSNESEEDSQEAISSENTDSEEAALTNEEELSGDTAIAEAETADDAEQETVGDDENTADTVAASSSAKKTKTTTKKSSGKSSSGKSSSSAATTASEETVSPMLDALSAEAVTYLSANGEKLNICLDDGESAYVAELKDSVLCLTPADQSKAWIVSLSAVEILRSCGITALEIVFRDTVYTLTLTTEETAESIESIPDTMAWRINEEGIILQFGIQLSQWILPEA